MPISSPIFQSVKTKQFKALDTMKPTLIKEHKALTKHWQVWECKLDELNNELNGASDNIYCIKSKVRRTIQGQIDKTASNEADVTDHLKIYSGVHELSQ